MHSYEWWRWPVIGRARSSLAGDWLGPELLGSSRFLIPLSSTAARLRSEGNHGGCGPPKFPADPVRFVCFRPVSSPCEAASFPRDTGRTGRGWTGSESSPHGIGDVALDPQPPLAPPPPRRAGGAVAAG
ncbi:unnamed protein product [Arctogadus glacialis]